MSRGGEPLDDEPHRQEPVAGSDAEREARLRLLTAQIPAIVWSTDRDLCVTWGAGAALKTLGFTAEQLVGTKLSEWLGANPAGAPQLAAHDAALRGESVSFTTAWAGRVFESYVEPLRNDVGAIIGTLGIAHDVTDRARAERERTLLQAKLRHQQRFEAIGTLASGVAHEINNPVQSIMNYAQLIRRRSTSPELETYASEILHEAQRVAAIVRNLRSFARQEGEPYAEVGLSEIVTSTLALIAVMLRKEGIDLRVEVPEDTPAVRCHPQQIQQVLLNLLTNARDALNERYPGVQDATGPYADKIVVLRCSAERGAFARLTVEDHGTGIRADLLDKIFDPFCTTKSQRPGAGLGLSISLAIVQEHGGTLSVESEHGSFTRAHLDLPLAHAQAASL